jgi:NAD(P)-dependent dehydrogenase (short-subunit alcohol dehydrogenase family)
VATGAAGLLGRQMSEALVEAGASVVIASRNLESCLAWVEELQRRGANALAVQVDVAQPESCRKLVESTLRVVSLLSAVEKGCKLEANAFEGARWND